MPPCYCWEQLGTDAVLWGALGSLANRGLDLGAHGLAITLLFFTWGASLAIGGPRAAQL